MPPPQMVYRLLTLSGGAPWIPASGQPLRRGTLEVTCAASLPDALALSPAQGWDVVAFCIESLLPLSCTEGLDALRRASPEATFLSVTARPTVEEAVSCLKEGVYEYLTLPLEPERFLQALAEAVENREAFREILDLNAKLEAQTSRLLKEKRELEKKNQELEAVSRVARAVSSTLELDEILAQLAQCIREAFGFERIVIGIVDQTLSCENAKVALGLPEQGYDEALRRMRWFLKDGKRLPWIRTVLREGRVLRVDEPASDPQTCGTVLAEIHKTAFVKMPMAARGRIVGTITVENPDSRNPMRDEDLGVLSIFADAAALAVENARLYQSMKELSVRDELTGLYNRRHFLRQLEAECRNAERHGSPLSLLVIDIDYFKRFNDGNDHLTGDAALRKAAATFLRNTRGIDTVARYGGEEFVAILPRTSRANAGVVAQKLRRAVERTAFDGEEVLPNGKLTVSVGVASHPEDGATPQELFEKADWALYRAKADGRNRVRQWVGEDAAPTRGQPSHDPGGAGLHT